MFVILMAGCSFICLTESGATLLVPCDSILQIRQLFIKKLFDEVSGGEYLCREHMSIW